MIKFILTRGVFVLLLPFMLTACDDEEPTVTIPKDEVVEFRINGVKWTSQVSSAFSPTANRFDIIAHDNLGQPNQSTIQIVVEVTSNEPNEYLVTRPQDGNTNILATIDGVNYIGSSCRPVLGEVEVLNLDRNVKRLILTFSGTLCNTQTGASIEITNGRVNDIVYED